MKITTIANQFDGLANGLRSIRDALAGAPENPTAARAAIAELTRAEADGGASAEVVEAIGRIGLLLEVGECLDESMLIAELSSFCVESLEGLAHGLLNDDAESKALKIVAESSRFWGSYLSLLDPDSSLDDEPESSPTRADSEKTSIDVSSDSSTIDAAQLFRLLTGAAATKQAAPTNPRPIVKSKVVAEVHPPHQLLPTPAPPKSIEPIDNERSADLLADWPILDPELKEAFQADLADLFERIEALVLGLSVGSGQEAALGELGRCFHTLKGAAGSTGFLELSNRVHHLEDQLEECGDQVSDSLIDSLFDSVREIEKVLLALKQNRPDAQSNEHEIKNEGSVESEESLPLGEQDGGLLRVPSARIDALMDWTAELLARRGFWTAQAARLKEWEATVSATKNRLLACVEDLRDALPTRLGEKHRNDELEVLIRRLEEQAADLSVLASTARNSAPPLRDEADALGRLGYQLWDSLQSLRIVPIRGMFQKLTRVARDAARVEGREVKVVMLGEETGMDRSLQDRAFEPLLHVVRNAVGHGVEPADARLAVGKSAEGQVILEARREGHSLVIGVRDDGRGLDHEAIALKGRRLGLIGPTESPSVERLNALIFEPGFSTKQEANSISGRGVGMDVVAREVARLRGTIDLTTQSGRGTRLTIRFPARLALGRVMVVRCQNQAFAIPMEVIDHVALFDPSARATERSRESVLVRDERVPLIDLRRVLGFSAGTAISCPKIVLIRVEGEPLAVLVEEIEGVKELVIKPLGPLLAGHPLVSGTSLSLNGEVILALDPGGLSRGYRDADDHSVPDRVSADETARPPRALVVDDSLSVRRVGARHLRALGFEVDEAADGVDALGRLRAGSYRIILSDLEMPRMDGFELLAELGRLKTLTTTPVIVASTRTDPETRRRVLELGAAAFLAKPFELDDLARVVAPASRRDSVAAEV